MSVVQRILMLLLAAAFIVAAAGYAYLQRVERQAAEQRADQAAQQLADAKATIAQLHSREAQLEALRRQAAAAAADLERALSTRETEIRRLQRENEDLRHWAALSLPEPVARLRRRPALTGADAYRQYLSDAEPLHAAGGGTGDQRRPAPGGGTR